MAGSKKHANINKKCNRHSEIVSCAPSTKQYTSLKAWNKHSTLFMVIFVVTCMRSPLHFFFKHTTQHHSIDWKRLIYTFTAANTLAQLFIPFWCSNLIRGYALHFRLNTYKFPSGNKILFWHFLEKSNVSLLTLVLLLFSIYGKLLNPYAVFTVWPPILNIYYGKLSIILLEWSHQPCPSDLKNKLDLRPVKNSF